MTHGPIACRDVCVAYRSHPALLHITGSFAPGSMTAVVGPNGAGKSTLLKALMGELPLAGGVIDRGGLPIQKIGYLPQVADVDRRFPIAVCDAVLLGLWRRIGAAGRPTQTSRDAVRQALATVGLEGIGHRHVGSLSVGQFQRVLFARLLLQDAQVILLDEPFAAVDEQTAQELLTIIDGWHALGRTIIAVLHDLAQVKRAFPQALLLARRAIEWGQTDAVLSPANLGKARALAGRWEETAFGRWAS